MSKVYLLKRDRTWINQRHKSLVKFLERAVLNLIDDEDTKKPLSDQKITEILHRDYDLKIARRTVAKYREKMGILPTSKRKRV